MNLINRGALLVALWAFAASATMAQAWLPRLGVATDSTTFASDSARLAYLLQSKKEIFDVSHNKSDIGFLPFMPIYKPAESAIVTPQSALWPSEKAKSNADSLYGLPAAAKVNKTLSDNTLQSIRKEYSQNPNNIKFVWKDIPEPYKNITEGRKATSRRDLRAISREMKTRQEFDNNLRQLPQKKQSPWKFKGEQNAQFSQLYVDNWKKGGETSAQLLFDFRANLLFKLDKHQWETNALHKLGLTYTSNLGTRISDDALELNSKYGYQAVSKWYYSFLASFKTQIFKSYDKNDAEKTKPLSAFMSPAYISLVVGMDYKNKDLSVLLSPYTADLNMVLDTITINKTNYKIPAGEKVRVENGFSVNLKWKKEIVTGLTYSTRAELFYPYQGENALKKFDWENIIDMQLNRWLSTRFLFNLRYYDNESSKFQVKENFSISFKMAFG